MNATIEKPKTLKMTPEFRKMAEKSRDEYALIGASTVLAGVRMRIDGVSEADTYAFANKKQA